MRVISLISVTVIEIFIFYCNILLSVRLWDCTYIHQNINTILAKVQVPRGDMLNILPVFNSATMWSVIKRVTFWLLTHEP